MIDHLSMIRALMGSRSQIWMPGTLVGIAPNSPRYSIGASGFGSHVSCWLGPPRIQRMMTEFSREGDLPCVVALASQRNKSDSDNPAKPSKPAFRKLRRSIAKRLRNSGHPMRVAVPALPGFLGCRERLIRLAR